MIPLRMALWQRGREGHPTVAGELIHHSDAGSQGDQRRSPRSRPTTDDGMAESFFATLKTEFYYRRVWPTQAGAKLAVGAWIEDRYNRRRRHSSIGQISPVAFEMQHCNQTAAAPQAA